MNNLIADNLQDYLFQNHDGISGLAKNSTEGSGITALISAVLPNVYIISAVILFLYMIFGGFLVISSAGDAKKTDEGKQALTNAIIGFGIIFASYWIIQIIEIITGIPIL
jgi:hypothetical protein